MKDFLLKSTSVLMTFVFLFTQTQAMASPVTINVDLPSIDVSVFELDEANLDAVLQELNVLESYLNLNEGMTYSDVEKNAGELVLNVNSIPAPAGSSDGPLGIPSFLWGCVFGVIGILIVYLVTDKDMDQTQKSFYGCLVGTGVSAILYFVIFAGAVAATTY